MFSSENRVYCWMILWCMSWFVTVWSCRDNSEIDFYISCRRCTVCETNAFVGEIRNLIPDEDFSFEVPLIAPVIANKALCWIDSKLSWNDLLNAWSKIMSPKSRWGLMKDLYIVTNDRLGKIIWSLCNSPMDLLTLLVMYFKYSPKFNLPSKYLLDLWTQRLATIVSYFFIITSPLWRGKCTPYFF